MGGGGGGALECNMTGRCPFSKDLNNLFRKKIEFHYPVSESLDQKTIGETVAYCSLTNIHNLLGNFCQFFYPVQEFKLKIIP